MIAVIFEVIPRPDQTKTYLQRAAALLPLLNDQPGFISVERFASLTNPSKLLSLSFFETEADVAMWRNRVEHRGAQSAGRHDVFADYRIRIASVIRDYGLTDREQAPTDSRDHHD